MERGHRPLCRADPAPQPPDHPSHAPASAQTSGYASTIGDSIPSSISLASNLADLSLDEEEERNRAFALQCGYSQWSVESGLRAIGRDATQEKLLNWLIHNASIRVGEARGLQREGQLRCIVIDGSNVAMTYAKKKYFGCAGIRECVEWFEGRGHRDIAVVVPSYRKETPRSDNPIMDRHILKQLDDEGRMIWSPSRSSTDGRRIVCHDDRYILKIAVEKDAVVVSNDEFRDMARESASFKYIVESRLLMYSFVDGKFMPPDDPLGRKGPSLHDFLSLAPPAKTRPCPYREKCTYGVKCKFLHSRHNGSVSDRIGMRSKEPLAGSEEEEEEEGGGGRGSGLSDSVSLQRESVARTSSLEPGKPSALPLHMHNGVSRQQSAPLAPSLFTPSTAVWGTPQLSVAPVSTPSHQTSSSPTTERERLAFHLSHVFPSAAVEAVMEANPSVLDAKVLCERIIQLQRGFEDRVDP